MAEQALGPTRKHRNRGHYRHPCGRAASYRTEQVPGAGGTAAHVLYGSLSGSPRGARLRRFGLVVTGPKVRRSIWWREPRSRRLGRWALACLRAGCISVLRLRESSEKRKMGSYVFLGLSHENPFVPLRPGHLKILHFLEKAHPSTFVKKIIK